MAKKIAPEIDLDTVYENDELAARLELVARDIFEQCLEIGGTEKQFENNCGLFAEQFAIALKDYLKLKIDNFMEKN